MILNKNSLFFFGNLFSFFWFFEKFDWNYLIWKLKAEFKSKSEFNLGITYRLDCSHQLEQHLGVPTIWHGSLNGLNGASMYRRNRASCVSGLDRDRRFQDPSMHLNRSMDNCRCHFDIRCNWELVMIVQLVRRAVKRANSNEYITAIANWSNEIDGHGMIIKSINAVLQPVSSAKVCHLIINRPNNDNLSFNGDSKCSWNDWIMIDLYLKTTRNGFVENFS